MGKTRCVFISATDKENVEELKQVLYEEVKAIFKVRYPYNNFLYWLFQDWFFSKRRKFIWPPVRGLFAFSLC
jgi:50S ribosomal subunit-associated GTPase HflX